MIDGRAIEPDDVVIGVASTGLHSNGYSLARQIVFDIAGLSVGDYVEELGQTVGDALLTPTQIYVRPVREVLAYYRVKNVVHGIAHITGGGLHENLERILPEGIQVGSTAAVGRCRRSSPGCSGWARSIKPKWTRSSTWASAWSCSSPPIMPRAFAINSPTPA